MKKVREFKLCKLCNKVKHRDEFHKLTLRSGKEGRQWKCKECSKKLSLLPESRIQQRASSRQWKEKIRIEIRKIKESSPCKDCNKSFPYYIMQFDHLENKSFNISGSVGKKNKKDIFKEIQKCELVCANCHAERTYKRSLCKTNLL